MGPAADSAGGAVRTVDELDDHVSLRGKRVLVRSDLNVPLDGARITDDGRIRASVPTIADLADRGARVVVCAHLGRPKGKPVPDFSLAPVGDRLAELLHRPVAFAQDTVGPEAQRIVNQFGDGEVALLENLRFQPGEESKDDAERGNFADDLAALADAYVGDGFGAVHRKHASVYDVPMRLPHAAGQLVLAETEVLQRLTGEPDRPYVVVLGGSKVSDKLAVLDALIPVVDRMLIGGGMVFTFLAAHGHEVGTSLLEADQVDTVRGYLRRAEDRGVDIVLPVDIVAATEVAADAEHDVVPADGIPADRAGVDIGPESGKLFGAQIREARTVFWNGPMGVFELEPYAEGTRAVAEALTEVTEHGGLTVVGGGGSAAAVRALGFEERSFGHISTGGGASLEFIEGKSLPGLTALSEPED
jgi:phosphoglycerate kinase